MQKLDKKQMPQLAVLVALTCLAFGFFAYRLIMPTPAAAGSAVEASPPAASPAPVVTSPAAAASGATSGTKAGDSAPLATVAGPPTPAMRDPFVQTVKDPGTPPVSSPASSAAPVRAISLSRGASESVGPVSVPAAPSLPAVGLAPFAPGLPARPGLAPMPVALAAPLWTVTGVLQSGGEEVAILRSGAARLFVKQGDMVDGQFQVARVTRASVMLRRGSASYTLPLGGSKTSGSAPSAAAPQQLAPRQFAPQGSAPKTAPAASGPVLSLPQSARAPRALPKLAFIKENALQLSALDWSRPQLTLPRLAAAPPSAPKLAVTPFAATCSSPAARLRTIRMQMPVLSLAGLKPSAVTLLREMTLPRRIASKSAVVKVAGLRQTMGNSAVRPADDAPALLPAGVFAPDFTLSTLSGQTLSPSRFRGRVVLLCFWASWLPACQSALTQMESLQSALGGQGLTVLSVNSWDSRAAMTAFVRAHSLSQVMLCDSRVPNLSAAVTLYHAPDLPAFYVIDPEGRVAASFAGYGPRTLPSLRAALQTLGVSE